MIQENVALKSQLNDSKPIVESKAESGEILMFLLIKAICNDGLTAAVDKLKAMEEKFAKVKQMYGSLRKEHVDLLKQVSTSSRSNL